MSGVSSIYSSSMRLKPIDKTAVACVVPKHKESAFKKRKKKRTVTPKVVKKKAAIKKVPKGPVSYKKAGDYNFIPTGVVVKGVPALLGVPGWTEAFAAIVKQLRLSLCDDLTWIERQYTREDVVGDYAPKQSCLWKTRHLCKILNLKNDDVMFTTGTRHQGS